MNLHMPVKDKGLFNHAMNLTRRYRKHPNGNMATEPRRAGYDIDVSATDAKELNMTKHDFMFIGVLLLGVGIVGYFFAGDYVSANHIKGVHALATISGVSGFLMILYSILPQSKS